MAPGACEEPPPPPSSLDVLEKQASDITHAAVEQGRKDVEDTKAYLEQAAATYIQDAQGVVEAAISTFKVR
jgi:hypothetical protein